MERLLIKAAGPAGVLAIVMGVASAMAIIFYAQIEQVLGPIQKIMYLHVPSAITCYAAFFVVAIFSGLFLWQREQAWDRIARSSAELGVLFCSIVLITGPIWGRQSWGVWWSWDARLTSTLLLWLIYLGYFVLRSLAGGEQGPRFAAVLGIIGVLDIPFINVAAEKFQTLHPPNLMKSGGMTSEMRATLSLCILTMLVFYVYLLAKRVALARLSDRVLAAREEVQGEMG